MTPLRIVAQASPITDPLMRVLAPRIPDPRLPVSVFGIGPLPIVVFWEGEWTMEDTIRIELMLIELYDRFSTCDGAFLDG